MANIGDRVLLQTDTNRFRYATIAGNISGNTADLCAFSDGNDWESQALAANLGYMMFGKTQGTGVGQWQPIVDPANISPTVSTPTRTIGGSPHQVSSTRPALVAYSARVVSAITLTAGQAGRIELRSDSSNPPTTVRARVAGGITGTLVVGATLTDINEKTLTYLVPAGHFVQIVSVNETGTPTYSLGAQVEEVL